MIRFVRALAATAALGLLVATPAPAGASTRNTTPTTMTTDTTPTMMTTETARPLRIMPLGDSITWGGGAPGHDSYRTDLYNRLATAGLDVDFVGSQHSGTGPDRDNE